jgi:hypothetical protein
MVFSQLYIKLIDYPFPEANNILTNEANQLYCSFPMLSPSLYQL